VTVFYEIEKKKMKKLRILRSPEQQCRGTQRETTPVAGAAAEWSSS